MDVFIERGGRVGGSPSFKIVLTFNIFPHFACKQTPHPADITDAVVNVANAQTDRL